MNKVVQYYFAYKFIKQLTLDFTRWDAYQEGLIDRDGNKLRDAEGRKEEEMLSPFFNLVRKTKRLLAKLPGGRSILGSVVAAGLLLKEDQGADDATEFFDRLLDECHKNLSISDDDCDKYLIESKTSRAWLPAGVYKNIKESSEFFDGDHFFYIYEEQKPISDCPVPDMFSLKNSKGEKLSIPLSLLERIRDI